MKRSILCLLLGVLSFSLDFGSAFAQEKPVDNFACTAPAVSHWSLGLKAGPAYLSGLDASFGGSLDYSINPFIGFGLEGSFLNRLSAVQVLGYGSLNLLNLCSTYRSGFWKRTNLFLVAGVGARMESASSDIFAMTGLNAEYNFNKALALELGTEGFIGNGYAVISSLGIRYKFTSSRHQHARNIEMCEYIPTPAPIVITETKGRDNSEQLDARLNAAEATQKALQQKVQKLTEDLNTLQNKK